MNDVERSSLLTRGNTTRCVPATSVGGRSHVFGVPCFRGKQSYVEDVMIMPVKNILLLRAGRLKAGE
jgi:hypothetical protein